MKMTDLQSIPVRSDEKLKTELVLADMIGVVNSETGERIVLWSRPTAEIEARGLPAKIVAVTFPVKNEAEVNRYREMVNQLKNGD